MRLHSDIKRMLDECGLPWQLENRRRHYIIVLAGRPIQALTRGGVDPSGRCTKNAVAQVRRCIQALQSEQRSITGV